MSRSLKPWGKRLPVISTFHEGSREAVIKASTDCLAAEGDSSTMGAHIVTLAQNQKFRQTIRSADWLCA
jgi:hypothetical protein